MTVTEVAKELGVHSRTIKKWIDKGSLTAVRINERGDYRITKEDLNKYLENFNK